MSPSHTKPELLAPAGDWEALRAAVANGADAVYFGLSNFNARARAANFEPEELPVVMRFLHARNVRGFIALNTLIFSDELPAVAEFVKIAAECGVDAVIVQDLGLVRLIRRIAPTLPVHASTQMTLTEPRGIAFVRQLGVERVVLARELSLEDIRKVTAGTETPVEVFVHGALCVAYSGQCLTSEALGGRSANRGQCAQACRLPYEMVVDGVGRDLGDRAYLLSPQDLAAYDHIQPLIDAGVISFKIEGRLKGGPYVAATTQTYRKAIDTALEERRFQLSRREELDLAQTFSRGLTPGFLDGNNHQKLVRGRFPKSRGVRLGKVVGFTKFGARVQLAEQLPVEELIRAGDGVVFDLGTPEAKEPGGRVWKVQESRSDSLTVEIAFEPGSIDLSGVPTGCEVWKTDDPALRKRLEQTYTQDRPARRLSLSARISGVVGGPLTLELSFARSGMSGWPSPSNPLSPGSNSPSPPNPLSPGSNSPSPPNPLSPGSNSPSPPNPLSPGSNSPSPPNPLSPGSNSPSPPNPLSPGSNSPSPPNPLSPGSNSPSPPNPLSPGERGSNSKPPLPRGEGVGGEGKREGGEGKREGGEGECLHATATWPGPLQLAHQQPTTSEEIRTQLGRLGDTPFELGELTIELPTGVLVPKSVLNDLRRQTAGELADRRSELQKHLIAEPNALEAMRASDLECFRSTRLGATDDLGGRGRVFDAPVSRSEKTDKTPGHHKASAPATQVTCDRELASTRNTSENSGSLPRLPRLTVLVRNLDQLEATLNWQPTGNLPRPEAIYCDFEDLRRYKDAVALARAAGMPVGLATLRVLKPSEDGFQSFIARAEPDIVLVRNLASISFFQEQLPTAQLLGDFSLNVANELTAELLMRAGLVRLVPSYDLNWDQLAALLRHSSPDWFEPVIHQHMPMFHMEHCVFAAFLSTGKDHRDCGRPCEVHKVELRDRVGANFPVLPDTGCRNTVFNSVAQSGAEYVGRMRELGLTRFRVDLLRETPEQVSPLLNRYARVIAGLDDGKTTWRELRALNQLGVTRGTLNLL